jgi:hypothetical protein
MNHRAALPLSFAVVVPAGAFAITSVALDACGGGDPPAAAHPADAGFDDVSPPGPTDDAGAAEASTSGSGSDAAASIDAKATEAGDATSPSPTQTFIRIADWSPDAPASGIDICLAPSGTTNWMGPLLGQLLPPGSLGQGGPNGVQFPSVTEYLGIAPGQYDIQIVGAGATNCTSGMVSTTGLPRLEAGQHTTFASVGDLHVTDNDAAQKVAVFFDDVTPSAGAQLRGINAVPSIAYIDFGEGSLGAQNFVPLVTAIAFGSAGNNLADGGTTGLSGYFAVAAGMGLQFSGHPTGVLTADTAKASNVTLASGSVTTMAFVNGENGGFPPQLLVCTDNGPIADHQTPCKVFVQ